MDRKMEPEASAGYGGYGVEVSRCKTLFVFFSEKSTSTTSAGKFTIKEPLKS